MLLGLEMSLFTVLLALLGTAVLLAVVLFILYPDRAAFTPKMPGTPMAPGSLPVVGHLFAFPTYQASALFPVRGNAEIDSDLLCSAVCAP